MRQNRKKEKNWIIRWIGLFCFLCINCLFLGVSVHAQEEDPINQAKQGIVEIYSGFTVDNGKFYQMQNASGFVICNDVNRAYIVTNYNTVKNSNKKKKKYCKKNNISTDGYVSLTDTIKVVVKGDVTVDATILTESKNENYCILQVDSSISERVALKLGTAKELVTGDSVYALGFAENAGADDEESNRHTEFSATDVEIREGKIQDTGANQNGILYLQHSALLSKGNTGGPILNTEGYVVGLNNTAISDDDTATYYSLPIDEIREILDNFQVNYESIDGDQSMSSFQELVDECTALVNDSSYKTKSKEALQTALEKAANITESSASAVDTEEIESVST
jgi:S1-C subfamily serine protease